MLIPTEYRQAEGLGVGILAAVASQSHWVMQGPSIRQKRQRSRKFRYASVSEVIERVVPLT